MLAITGGEKTKTKPFPPWPYYDHEEEEALREVLKSRQWWRTPGTKTMRSRRKPDRSTTAAGCPGGGFTII